MIGMPSRVRSAKKRWIELIRSACARAIAPLSSLVEIWRPNTPCE
jgi:hypothetical protein